MREAVGLAEAIDLAVVHSECVSSPKITPGAFFGSGAVARLGALVNMHRGAEDQPPPLVFVDAHLSPVQQRNLERTWKCKVVDRTGMILEIFGERARTAEGELQVELAALSYQRSRLVRSWTHLERQRGGFGFLGGPGEAQIETDRRMIRQRIATLKTQLERVRRTRALHREARRRADHPLVAIVGYTNAGKSTLFNRLTEADALVANQLFATLDPTMRGLTLRSGRRVILSDTVGFISDLPHELVEAFRATLEEVTHADVVLHVCDVASPHREQQKADVEAVLASLDVFAPDGPRLIEVANKRDLLSEEERLAFENQAARRTPPATLVSAATGEGVEALLSAIDAVLADSLLVVDLSVEPWRGADLAWLYEHAEVLDRVDAEDAVRMRVRLSAATADRFEHRRRTADTSAIGEFTDERRRGR